MLFRNIINHIKWFYQRLTLGFDDRETYSIDYQFYKWLLPRLVRFVQLNDTYPNDYKSFEEWREELDMKIQELVVILAYYFDEYDFPYTEIYDKSLVEHIKEKYPDETDQNLLNSYAFEEVKSNFNKWFANKLPNLWW